MLARPEWSPGVRRYRQTQGRQFLGNWMAEAKPQLHPRLPNNKDTKMRVEEYGVLVLVPGLNVYIQGMRAIVCFWDRIRAATSQPGCHRR